MSEVMEDAEFCCNADAEEDADGEAEADEDADLIRREWDSVRFWDDCLILLSGAIWGRVRV